MRKYFNIPREKSRRSKCFTNSQHIYPNSTKIFPLNTLFLPRRFLRFFRRRFKKFFRKKKVIFSIFVFYNFIVSHKGKNPRMGKGIGFFVRKCVIVHQNNPIFYFRRYNYQRSVSFSNYLKKKTHINSYIFRKVWYF